MKLEAKFGCLWVQKYPCSERVRLIAGDENSSWAKGEHASGHLKLLIGNPSAMGLFQPGKAYKVTIEEIDESEPVAQAEGCVGYADAAMLLENLAHGARHNVPTAISVVSHRLPAVEGSECPVGPVYSKTFSITVPVKT
jgi:hypothetical protein